MRINALPHEVLCRLLSIDDHATACAQAAALADSALAEHRAILRGDFQRSGRMKDDAATVAGAQASFNDIHQRSQAMRRRADDAQRCASACKAYVDRLPADVEFVQIEPPKPNGIELAAVRAKLALLRGELTKLRSLPPPSDRALVEGFVDAIRRSAREQVDRLVSRWPHFAMGEALARGDDRTVIDALTTVVTPRAVMIDELCRRIDCLAAAVLPPDQRPEKISALEAELAGLQALEVMFIDAAIANGDTDVAHSPDTLPAVLLGITVTKAGRQLAS